MRLRLRLRLDHMAVLLFCAAIPSVARAGSCKALLTFDQSPFAHRVSIVTLNGDGVATYATDYVEFRQEGGDAGRPFARSQVPSPIASWSNTNAYEQSHSTRQLWSDRYAGDQPFAVSKNDLIGITITQEDSPKVTIILKSWGNVPFTFVGDCSPEGMMHGVISITERTGKILYTHVLLRFWRDDNCVFGVCG